jgi:hypothetical protein
VGNAFNDLWVLCVTLEMNRRFYSSLEILWAIMNPQIDKERAKSNKWARVVDFLFDWVKEGYIVEFSIECIESFSQVERKFDADPRKRLLEETPLWIKMLLMEKGMMHMELDKISRWTPSYKVGGMERRGKRKERMNLVGGIKKMMR